MKTNFCNCTFLYWYFSKNIDLSKSTVETCLCNFDRYDVNYAFTCNWRQTLSSSRDISMYVHMDSQIFSLSEYQLRKSFAKRKRGKRTISGSFVSPSSNIAPGLPSLYSRSLLQADWNFSLPGNPKRTVDAHPFGEHIHGCPSQSMGKEISFPRNAVE